MCSDGAWIDEQQQVFCPLAERAKRQWLFDKLLHPQKYHHRPHPPGKEVVNGESAPYLGKEYQIEVAETGSGDIEFRGRFIVPTAHQAKRRKVLRDWYIARAIDQSLANARSFIALGIREAAML
jgi:predicted metal-dependent hydrolase